MRLARACVTSEEVINNTTNQLLICETTHHTPIAELASSEQSLDIYFHYIILCLSTLAHWQQDFLATSRKNQIHLWMPTGNVELACDISLHLRMRTTWMN